MPDLQATTTVKSFVNLKKSSLHLLRDQGQEQKFGLEFKFDSEKDCVISVHFVCKESTEQNSTVYLMLFRVLLLFSFPHALFFYSSFTCLHENSSYSKTFSKGMDQSFVLPEEAYLNVAKSVFVFVFCPHCLFTPKFSHPTSQCADTQLRSFWRTTKTIPRGSFPL